MAFKLTDLLGKTPAGRAALDRETIALLTDELRCANAELAAMRDFLPDPESCSGWDDAGAPEEVAVDLANLARLKGVAESTWPAHIKAAAVRLTE